MTGVLVLSRLPIAGILIKGAVTIAHLQAIVAHEEDIGVVLDAEFIDALEDSADKGVHVFDHVTHRGFAIQCTVLRCLD